jgi:hypothetical protein
VTTGSERRRDGRAAPAAGWRIRIAQIISEAADWFGRDLFTKSLLGALLLSAMGLMGWSLGVQLKAGNEFNAAIQREVSLSLALDDLRATVLRMQYQHLEDQIQRAEQKLVPDYGTLAKWLHDLQASSATRGIALTYTVNEEQVLASRPGLLAVPLILTVQAQDGARAYPYSEGLSLLRALSAGPWAGELVAADGEGEGRGLERMSFEYRIWMHARDGFGPEQDNSMEGEPVVAAQTVVPEP